MRFYPHGEGRGTQASLRSLRKLGYVRVSNHEASKTGATYFSPTLNGGSLPGGTVSSATARIIATIT
jgi:hypothetical protein